MSSDASQLATHTHLTQDEAQTLLETRTLSGNPESHDHPAVIITEDEIIVETRYAFNNSRFSTTPSAIEMAFVCGTTVEQMRKGQRAAAQLSQPEDDTE